MREYIFQLKIIKLTDYHGLCNDLKHIDLIKLQWGGGCTATTNTIEAQFPATEIRTSLKYIIFISKIAYKHRNQFVLITKYMYNISCIESCLYETG